MADFTQYSEYSGEWRRELEEHPQDAPTFAASGFTEEVQTMANGMRAKASQAIMEKDGLRSNLIIHTFTIPIRDGVSLDARAYIPSAMARSSDLLPVYIYFHGGAFFTGTLDTEDANCAGVAAALGNVVVLNINYRHVPRFTYPTQHLDIFDAFDWLMEGDNLVNSVKGDRKRVVVGGESSGANLAAALVVHEVLRGGELRIAGLHLVLPWLVVPAVFPTHFLASKEKWSWVQNKDALILQSTVCDAIISGLKISDPADNYFNTLNRPDEVLKKFPPTAIAVCGGDPLRDEGLVFGRRLVECGVATKVHCFQGMPHGFAFRYPHLKTSKRYHEVIAENVKWLASGDGRVSSELNIIKEVTD